jgi:hypothetical protein
MLADVCCGYREDGKKYAQAEELGPLGTANSERVFSTTPARLI